MMNSNTATKENVSTSPSEGMVEAVASNRAITYAGSFAAFRDLLERCPPLKRPNRNRPINNPAANSANLQQIAARVPTAADLDLIAVDVPAEWREEKPWPK
jgi:hypothetical protein